MAEAEDASFVEPVHFAVDAEESSRADCGESESLFACYRLVINRSYWAHLGYGRVPGSCCRLWCVHRR